MFCSDWTIYVHTDKLKTPTVGPPAPRKLRVNERD